MYKILSKQQSLQQIVLVHIKMVGEQRCIFTLLLPFLLSLGENPQNSDWEVSILKYHHIDQVYISKVN